MPVQTTCLTGWHGHDVTLPEKAEEMFVDGAALHQLWLRRPDPSRASLSRLLADPDAAPGWRFDGSAYRALLTRMASAIGVARVGEAPCETPWLLCETRRGENGWADWSDWLPAFDNGTVTLPGETHDMERICWDGEQLEATSPAHRICFSLGGPVPGRQSQPWTDRTIRLGDAAIGLPPVLGLPLTAALQDILRAIRFIPPTEAAFPAVAREYNRQTETAHRALLEWAAAPFLLTRGAAIAAMPPGLAAIVRHFIHRGRLPVREGDPVARGRWIALLAGCGLTPDRIDPTARVPDDARADHILTRAAARHPLHQE